MNDKVKSTMDLCLWLVYFYITLFHAPQDFADLAKVIGCTILGYFIGKLQS